MHPCAGSIWLNFGPLLFGRRPKPGGSPVVYRSIRPRDPDDESPLVICDNQEEILLF